VPTDYPGLGSEKVALLMVGLPARGKSYVARKVAGYLSWLGSRTRVFNVGAYRRQRLGGRQTHEFFDPANQESRRVRRELALGVLDEMLGWLRTDGDVAIYDATNTTRDRRTVVRERCQAAGVRVVYVESICDDPSIIAANVRETKLRSPDYAGMDAESAVRDFETRIAHYARAYEPVADDEGSYVKLIDVGRKVVANRMVGWLASRLVSFLMNVHTARSTIWLTRHGESEFNVEGRIGGDSGLTERGELFARSVRDFLEARLGVTSTVSVWTSTMRRSIETSAFLPWRATRLRALDEIDAGVCDGMTYAQIAERMPEEYAARADDKLRYRYPRGESYQDIIQRLDPVIIDLERQRAPLVVIGHLAVTRTLYGYLMQIPRERCPHLDIPLHTMLELTPTAYGVEERRHPLEPQPDPRRPSFAGFRSPVAREPSEPGASGTGSGSGSSTPR